MAINFLNNPKVGDNVKIEVGDSSDLQIYHDTTDSYITNTTGDLTISNTGANSDDLILKSADDFLLYVQGTELAIQAVGNSGVLLRHNNVVKFETTSGGIRTYGDILIEDSSPQIHFLDTTNNNDSYIYSDDQGSLNISADENNEQNSSKVRFYIDGSEKVRFVSNGNVGIGETSVDARLHITKASAGLVNQKFESAGSAAWRLGIPASQTYFAFDNANDNLSSPKLIISSSGNLGIGTTSATNKLTISDNSAQILLIDTSTSNKGEIEIGDADFTFNLDRDGSISSGKFSWRIDDITRMELGLDSGDLGQLRLNEYGSGNITGTATFLLGVDENGYIIEESTSGGGTVTGTGAATRVAFWSGTSALSSDANLYWDNTNDRLGIGTSTPSEILHLYHATTNTLAYLQSGDATTVLAMADNDGSTRIESDSGEFRFRVGGTASTAGSNTTEAMRITSGARVGIGLVSPSTRLHVRSGTENVVARFESTDTAATIQLKDTTGTVSIESRNDFRFSNSSGEKMRIDSSGNVGIGTTSPIGKFNIQQSSINVPSLFIGRYNSENIPLLQIGESTDFSPSTSYGMTLIHSSNRDIVISTATDQSFTDVDTAAVTIKLGNGNVGIGDTSPDAKLHVHSGSTSDIVKFENNNGSMVFGQTTALTSLDLASSNAYRIRQGSSTPFKIETTGDSTFAGEVEVINANGLITGRSSSSANTNSSLRFMGGAYTGNKATAILYDGVNGENQLYLGGGTSLGEPATNIRFHTGSAGATGAGTERMRIESDGTSILRGSVKINTGADASNPRLYFQQDSLDVNNFIEVDRGTGAMEFYNNGSERMRIDSAGNVAIGTTSASAKINVANSTNQNGGTVENSNASFDQTGLLINNTSSTSGELLRLRSSGSNKFIVTGAGRVAIDATGTVTSPSQRFEVNAGTENSVAKFQSTDDTAQIIIKDDDTTMYFGARNNVGYISPAGSAPASGICVNTDGKVGIGTATPEKILHIFDSTQTNQTIRFGNPSATPLADINYNSSGNEFLTISCKGTTTGFGNIVFETGPTPTEAMRIDSSGNVSIKAPTASGGGVLNLENTTNAVNGTDWGSLNFISNDTSTGASGIRASVVGTSTSFNGDGNLVFNTAPANGSNTERMRITSGGDVLIGKTTTPSFSTVGITLFSDGSAELVRSNDKCLALNRRGSDGNIAQFYKSDTEVGKITVTSVATSYVTSSDYRLKENVVGMTGALDRVAQLKPSRFNFIADSDTTVDGFLAHEVQSVVPEAITGTKDAVDEEGNPEYQGIDQSKLVPLLVGAIQELRAEIELLKNK